MLSPIFSGLALGEVVASRSDHLGSTLWWVGLWDAAAAAAAVGLCWLTVRTVDGAFGRIPERPRNSHWMADVVVAVAGVTAAACLVEAMASWVGGVHPRLVPEREEDMTLFGFILLELLGLILLAVLAAVWSRNDDAERGAKIASPLARSSAAIVLSRWWHIFRFALLLAVAPGLIALALATARDFWPEVKVAVTSFGPQNTKAVMVTYTTPSGETSRRMITGDRNDANVQTALKELRIQGPVLSLGDRLRDAGLLMLTFLAHAAATTSVGLALAIGIKRRRTRIAVAVSAPLIVAVVWLIGVYAIVGNHDIAQRLYALSPVWVADHLMEPLIARQPHPKGLLGWIAAWDAGAMLFAMGLLYLVVCAEKRRAIVPKGQVAEELNREATLEVTLVGV